MDPKVIASGKKVWGWSDEQIAGLTPKNQRVVERGEEFRKWRLIAEVLEARHCICGLKKGDKYVFHGSGFLLPNETTCPKICLWAFASFAPFSYMLYDRLGQGQDASEFWLDRIRCLDVGVERGGYGETLFRLYGKRIEDKK